MSGQSPVRPLQDYRVLITRPRSQARELCVSLEAQGARSVVVPALEFAPPLDPAPLDAALKALAGYQWIAFTSGNGVDYTVRRLNELGLGTQTLSAKPIAAIGTATVEALERQGLKARLVPHDFTNEAFSQALASCLQPDQKVLLPRAELADDTVPALLRAAGFQADTVIAYRSFAPKNLSTHAREAFKGGVDIVTFTSPSTVKNLISALGEERDTLDRMTIACIGPATARAARAAGLTVDVEAREQTAKGLVEALVEWASRPTRRRPF